jgi:positive phototaxis protein PixI
MMNSGSLAHPEKPTADLIQILQFRATDGSIFALPTASAIEILQISVDRIVPIPHLPPAVLGIHNWRGEMLWVADLANMLALDGRICPLSTERSILVIGNDTTNRLERLCLGLLVAEVLEIEWHPRSRFTERVDGDLSYKSFLAGTIDLVDRDERLLLLDGRSILANSHLHAEI